VASRVRLFLDQFQKLRRNILLIIPYRKSKLRHIAFPKDYAEPELILREAHNLRAELVTADQSIGKLLCDPIFQTSGKKLFAKGHLMSTEDATILTSVGLEAVNVAVFEADEVREDEAAKAIAIEAACMIIDEIGLCRTNQNSCVTIATVPNFSYVVPGQRVATVKSAPFAVPQSQFQEELQQLRDAGPIIQARPIRRHSVAVLYSDPRDSNRAREQFHNIMNTRLHRFGAHEAFVLSCIETVADVSNHLRHLLRARPTVVLLASTTAPAGPEDVVGSAMSQCGCRIESFLAPVEPGNLLLLGYLEDIPVVAAPGCFRSPKQNVVDLILPALLARYPLGVSEIAALGHGGLLEQ
jgi:molybdenum cofactor cytidylyltransferase